MPCIFFILPQTIWRIVACVIEDFIMDWTLYFFLFSIFQPSTIGYSFPLINEVTNITHLTHNNTYIQAAINGAIVSSPSITKVVKAFSLIKIDIDPSKSINTKASAILDQTDKIIDFIQSVNLTQSQLEVIHRNLHEHLNVLFSILEKVGPSSDIRRKYNLYSANGLKNYYRNRLKLVFLNNSTDPKKQILIRPKRGLINIGGEILKTLFGTATDEDLQTLTDQTRASLQGLSHTMTIFGIDLVEMHSNMNRLLTHVRLIISQMEKFEENINQLDVFFKLSQTVQFTADYIEQLLIIFNKYETSITFMDNGILSKLITHSVLKTAISEARNKFPELDFPFTFSSQNISLIYSFLHVEKTKVPFQYLIPLPLVSKETYKHFNVSPFVTLDHSQNPVQPKNLRSPLIVDSTFSKILVIISESESCWKAQDILLCVHVQELPPSSNSDFCTLQLISGNNPSDCLYEQLPEKNIYVTNRAFQKFIFIRKPTTCAITCGSTDPHLLPRQGLIILNSPCKFISQELEIDTIKTQVEIKKLDNILIPFEIYEDFQIENTQLFFKGSNLSFTQKDLVYDNKSLIELWRKMIVQDQLHSTHLSITSTFIITCLVAFILIGVIIYKLRKLMIPNTHTQPNEIPLQSQSSFLVTAPSTTPVFRFPKVSFQPLQTTDPVASISSGPNEASSKERRNGGGENEAIYATPRVKTYVAEKGKEVSPPEFTQNSSPLNSS